MGACQSSTSAATNITKPQHEEVAPDVTVTTRSSFDESSPKTDNKSNPKILSQQHSSSVGLDTIIAERKTLGHLVSNVVNIESVRSIEEVYDGVHDGKLLGEGVAGKVRLVKHKATGIPYAVKVLNLKLCIGHSRDNQVAQEQLRNEITIMSQLDHPNIARLQEVYEDENEIYLVQELGTGGELFDVLDEQPDYHYSEPEALRLLYQMLSALRYLHSKGIIHRDLKLENFLFSTNRHLQLKMIDFGLSKHFDSGEVQHDAVGTPYTVAPEVIKGNYDEKCDLWAIGVLAFMLLSGDTPFGGCGLTDEPLTQLKDNILNCRYAFEPEYIWAKVSPEARDFVRTLLVTDPKLRPSCEEAQKHPWIRAYHEACTGEATLNPKLIKALVTFKSLPITKRMMFEVVSFTMLEDQIMDVQAEFEKMDTDGLGEISLDCMIQVLSRSSDGQEGLSEQEIIEIFNTMKVGKSEPRVHWHEFVAACLAECRVNDGNLRIAFDRLDIDHDGFISFEEVIQLIARDANENEDVLRETWVAAVDEYHCQHGSEFNYEEFCQLVHMYV